MKKIKWAYKKHTNRRIEELHQGMFRKNIKQNFGGEI